MSGNGSARRRRSITSMLVLATGIAVVLGGHVRPAVAGGDGGVIGLVSHSSLGPTTAAAGATEEAITSADGGIVVFTSTAGDVVAGQSDGNDAADLFLFERATGTTTLVSHAPGSPTTAANSGSRRPSVTADGAWVTFASDATNLVAGQTDANNAADVFLFERATGTVTLVSHTPGSATTTANSESSDPSISATGAFVAFVSLATALVPGQTDGNGAHDVFLFERATATVTLVSHTSATATTTPDNASSAPTISADGDSVVFSSTATNVVAGQVDSPIVTTDAFLFSRATNAVTLVSHAHGSLVTTGNGVAAPDLVTDTGPLVIFRSTASNLVAGQVDFSGDTDVFLFDGATNAVTLVSHTATSATTAANGASAEASMSEGAAFVAFQSFATNLVTGQSDSNNNFDVFLFERATGAVTLVSHIPGSATIAANDESTDPSISADGTLVAFRSLATDLVPDQIDAAATDDVFLFERATGAVSLVSHPPGVVTRAGNGNSAAPAISADGASVTFVSLATDLVAGQVDANEAFDAFVYARSSVPAAGTHADFDGDGDTDVSVFRPSAGFWFVAGGASAQFGTSGDIPVPGDYDGDGDTDFAVFRPSTGFWFVNGGAVAQFGTSGDIPVPGDYDGDGDTDFAVFRPSTGFWFVNGGAVAQFGTSGDIPVPGDYDGDGDTDFAVFRPSTGFWFVNGGAVAQFGTSGDIPVPGDYDGDGDTDFAVFRPSTGFWFVNGGAVAQFGTSGDIPAPGDYDGDGDTDFAVFRPSTGFWFVNGGAVAQFGTSGDVPLPLPDAIRRFFFPPL